MFRNKKNIYFVFKMDLDGKSLSRYCPVTARLYPNVWGPFSHTCLQTLQFEDRPLAELGQILEGLLLGKVYDCGKRAFFTEMPIS